MPREDVSIRTKDGECRTSVYTPAGNGPWPAVIFYMDAFAIRPMLHQMAQRIADFGYVVLLPDQFYRHGPYAEMKPKEIFAGDMMAALAPFIKIIDTKRAAEDAGALLAYLDTRGDVLGKKVGAHGYCMGGSWALAAAAAHPDRIAAVATFHGGHIATESPLSPHLQFDKIKAFVYIAAADKDGSYPPDMAAQVVKALVAGSVAHKHELYKDALHGWTMADFPVYKKDDSERHFEELRTLYDKHLR
jgi:carboxymethylenebutenolidase